jgi:hypothetical protein
VGPAAAGLAQVNGAHGHDATHHFFEGAADEGDVVSPIERAGERSKKVGKSLPAITLACCGLRHAVRLTKLDARHHFIVIAAKLGQIECSGRHVKAPAG